jgi:hypothetical protein
MALFFFISSSFPPIGFGGDIIIGRVAYPVRSKMRVLATVPVSLSRSYMPRCGLKEQYPRSDYKMTEAVGKIAPIALSLCMEKLF